MSQISGLIERLVVLMYSQESPADGEVIKQAIEELLRLRAELARAEAVAQAAELVCARLGSIGSIYSDHCTVDDLMNALHEWKSR